MPIDTEQPKYRRLAEMLRTQIKRGELTTGDRLPSLVQMHQNHGATKSTMVRVYELLEKDNLIERRGGSGVYVADAKSTLTGNIGLIAHEDLIYGQTDYQKNILGGIHKFVKTSHQHLLFLGDYSSTDMLSYEKVDGILTYNIEYQQHRLKHLSPNKPRVSMFIKEDQVTSVIADDYEGTKSAVRHLVDLGHRRIACLMEKYLCIPQRRFMGYRDALSEAGIDPAPEWIRLTDVANARSNRLTYLEWGRLQMSEWLAENWKKSQCTAILVQNDTAAIGVMQVLQDAGISIPDEVSVMGFDGTELCDHVTPRLCSMKIPLEEIAYRAAEILHQQIHHGQTSHQTVMLPMSLRPGDSVATAK